MVGRGVFFEVGETLNAEVVVLKEDHGEIGDLSFAMGT